jgi:hypothetical protein
MSAFSPKQVAEIVDLSVNFTYLLSPSETITSATCFASVYLGVDASPASILLGSPTINASLITQRVRAGIASTAYSLSFGALTSNSQYFLETHTIAVF